MSAMEAVATSVQSGQKEAKQYSVLEYLETELRTGERHVYYNGKIKAMAGGTLPHNRIARNILSELHCAFKSKPQLEAFRSDQKIYLPKYNFYLYPDAVVIAAPPIVSDLEANAIVNPLLIIEVLSPSTENYDRNLKFTEYRSIETFREYALVRQDAPEVLTFFRSEPHRWDEEGFTGVHKEVYFKSIDLRLGFDVIYKDIKFNA